MKTSTFNSKALLLVLLLVGAVLFDSFASEPRIFPHLILYMLQGFLLLSTALIVGWIASKKIQVYVDGPYLRIEINYRKAKNYDAQEKIY